MKFRPKNTLAYFNAAPQVHEHNLSELPTAVFAEATLKYRKECGMTSPMGDAVTFYTLNHCASIVRKAFTENEPLPEWARTIMQNYTDVCMAQGERMLHYILCITTRETRHLKSCTPAFWAKVEKEYGPKSSAILKHVSSDGGEDTAMNKYMKTPPDMTIGHYTKTLAYAFHHAGGSGWSHSYGGHPWGQVTDAVIAYLTGVTSMEMLVDTGYTLAHNGGPIFNKGLMYSGQDQNQIFTILDVQRSGQMLDLMSVPEAQTNGVKKTDEATAAVALITAHCPVDANGKLTVKGYVDWKLVDELRPSKDKAAHPSKYTKVSAAQKQPMAKTPKAAKAEKAATETMTTLLGKKVKKTGEWQVFPHQTVGVYERTGG